MTSLESDPPTGRAADPASATTSPTPGSDPAPLPPGSPAALAAGCRCSVLANAAYRCGASGSPLIEPACTVVHAEPTQAYGMSLPHGPVHEFGIHLLWRSADTVVLEVVGEIDLWAASTLLAAAEDELADGRRLLVIDAAGVSFCSARGVGTLVEVRRRAHRRGAAVRVVNPSRHVRRVALLGRWCDGSGRTDELA